MKGRIAVVLIAALLMGSCAKKLTPKDVAGSYAVADSWKSNKELIGTGSLSYDLEIVADGDAGVILMNVNKTLNGVKGLLKGDEIVIDKQTIASASGNLYDVLPSTGKIIDNKIVMTFMYSDEARANGIGEIKCDIIGSKGK